ncbi:P-loop containing nucleoside triphosphate hydrolase protein [Tribonema minus]|uniref:P-loop containing nucleoside triphosphate hydrolase protein n=1 Tax=Tribonema minus TaxID=303371 RepID=A0A835ZIB0_9STRA|nr:P-loop containing nucleoside triphosphate hydrolase protein [Tribonema minus]
MGLGKTLQTAAFLWHLYCDRGKAGPFLVVAPLSTVAHWQREIEGWTGMNTVVYHGSQEDRSVIEEYELYFDGGNGSGSGGSRRRRGAGGYKPVVIVTTPDMVARPDVQRVLGPIEYEVLVVDEAHRLKNDASVITQTLAKRTGRYDWKRCLLLTGTPLQNSTEELWTLLNFVDPDKFAEKSEFAERFGDMSNQSQVEQLVKVMKAYVLRRMKEDVEKGVPPKQETLVEVELTGVQKQYYRALYEQNTQFLLRGGKRKVADRPSLMNLAMELRNALIVWGREGPSLMNLAMELRKCCNHPYLIKGAELTIKENSLLDTGASELDQMVACSGKLVLLDKLLPRLREQGHRVLIFSQFKIMLDIIEDFLIGRRYSYGRIDGNITGPNRQRQIDAFQAEGSTMFVMMLSTKAGGVGITLTAADTVIIFDSDWNPQNDLQAQARCHRIGQTKSVKVYRLLTRKTYEQVMFQAASKKLGLDQAVLSQGRASRAEDGLAKVSVAEVEGLLRRGAYDAFKEGEDGMEASRKFCESDIDVILQRSQASSTLNFSKASFVADGEGGEPVDLDDPDFWTKVSTALHVAKP